MFSASDRHGAQREVVTGGSCPHETPAGGDLVLSLMADDELPYVLGSWSEGYKFSERNAKLSWAIYKKHVVPELAAVLGRSDTFVLCARQGDVIVGWIAYCRGRSVDTVHWVHTRFRIGESGSPLRRNGIMTELINAASGRDRIVYTHRGPKPKHRGGVTSDEWISRWLAGRGVIAVFVPYEEWKK